MESDGSGLRYRLRRALRQIGEQHQQLRELHSRLRRAVASGDRRDARDGFRRYREAVGAHFALEDGVFFPALHGLHPEHAEELDPLVLRTFEEAMNQIGTPRDDRTELGRSYLAAVERLGFA